MTVLFPGCQWQVGTRDGDVTLIVPTFFGGQNSLSIFLDFIFLNNISMNIFPLIKIRNYKEKIE
jgi:hypothetical protein